MSKKFKNLCHYLMIILVIKCSTVAAYSFDFFQDNFPEYPPFPVTGFFTIGTPTCSMQPSNPPSTPASITWGGVPIGVGMSSEVFQCTGSYGLQYIIGPHAGTKCSGTFSDSGAGMATNGTGLLNPFGLSYNFMVNNQYNNCTSSAFQDLVDQPLINVFITCSVINGKGGTLDVTSLPYPTSCTGPVTYLYVLNYDNDSITKYALSDLAVSGSPAPRVTISGAATTLSAPCFGTFASDGSLWLGNFNHSTTGNVLQFTAAQLAASGSPVPNTILNSTAFNSPCGVAFDSLGGLWVSDFVNTQIVHFTAAQVAAGGTQTPDKILTNNAGSINTSDGGMMFDATGNLWFASFSSQQISKFSPAQLAVAGTSSPVPVVKFTNDGVDSPDQPQGLMFDASGNLWITNAPATGPGTQQNIVQYAASRLSTGGAGAPNVHISATPVGFNGPGQIVFDSSGNAWVTSYRTNQFFQFSAAQLTTSGDKTPVVTINVPATGPYGLLIK